jgi:hypothetical protein
LFFHLSFSPWGGENHQETCWYMARDLETLQEEHTI